MTEALQCNIMTTTGQDTDDKIIIYKYIRDNYLYLKADNRYVGRSIYISISIYINVYRLFESLIKKKGLLIKMHIPNTST